MKKIVFATNNQHKLDEIRQILGSKFDVLSLNDIGCHEEIPEDYDTLQENALQKAKYIAEHYDVDCFADDTGLEVDALNGEPGVHSARYAEGTDHDSEANMQKLLRKLGNNNNRSARFRTVIALVMKSPTPTLPNREGEEKIEECRSVDDTPLLFEGIVNGHIAYEKKGTEGFGYDPIFVPDGYDESFAQLGMDIKNSISHRARAVAKLADYLRLL
ncbi:MAG: non-canonical purine NTP pyrophosphatase [Prevotella sp.]|nr:non-canonical purine NTP pyrophosphatase [Prevotella sp.]